MPAASNLHSVNGKDLYDVFGVTVQTGQAGFDTPFPVKPSLKHSWPGQEGLDIDVSQTLQRDAKEITLKCTIVVFDRADFYAKKTAFENEMRKPGYQTWYVADHDKSYSVKYEGSKNGDKPFKRYVGAAGVVHSFDMTLTVQPDLQAAFNTDVTITLNGTFHGVAAAGSTYNVQTLGAGVTPTVSTPTATVSNNKITVSATASAGYTIQYALEKKDGTNYITGPYQSLATFEGVANGTYRPKVRLLEAVNTTATGADVTVNYTAPVAPETLSITNVTGQDNKITILASKANTTRAIEYSLDNTTWQTSNIFTVANGTYSTFYARLAAPGATVTATYSTTITINYTAPVTSFNMILYPGDSLKSITYNGLAGTEFHFNSPVPLEPPFPASMTLYLGATALGMVDFNTGALGRACAIKYNGVLYPTTFQDSQNVIL